MDKLYSRLSANSVLLENYDFQSERIMEAYLIENPDVLKLDDSDTVSILGSQLPVSKRSGKGFIDLLVSYNPSLVAIVELKKGILSKEDFKQLNDYFSDLKESFKDNKFLLDAIDSGVSLRWRGVLIGTGVEQDLLNSVGSLSMGDDNYPFSMIVLRRYRDKSSGQVFISSDIYTSKKGRQTFKYSFMGTKYPQYKIVHALVKQYLLDNPDVSFKDLSDRLSVIPNSIHNIKRYSGEGVGGYTAHLTNKEDLLYLNDGSVFVVAGNFASEDRPKVELLADNLGYTITEVN